ncbi:MAG: pyridoxamine 5'-phosphate oxidase family protein [Tissierellales bacterium]|jgi:predicted pyridoxine 5'-phosphate oxidase superfamily flavin-nucleotide-binding protein|nr:pyridoxamine 5'-phosphate oxidase family protein [Tissierellales bacterium]
MTKLNEKILKEWENRQGPIVFTTVNEAGVPNSIYATCVNNYNDEFLVVADNYFDKTKNNLMVNQEASILFYTKDDNAYQVKGTVEYLKSGAIFEDMKKWNPEKHPGNAAAALKVREVYSGSEKVL